VKFLWKFCRFVLIKFCEISFQVYPCVSECLGNIYPKKLDYVIITTKQERFVKAILEKNVITPPANENIYDLDNPFGAKTKVTSVTFIFVSISSVLSALYL
jgi:hypothetical protein